MASLPTKTLALLIRSLLGLVLLIGAVGITFYLVATKPQVSTTGLESQPVRVQVLRVERVEVARQWRGYGSTQAKDEADVPARIASTVTEVPEAIEVGRVVEMGQVLAKLDATDFENALTAAEQRIEQADALVAQLDTQRENLKKRIELEQKVAELARAEFDRQKQRIEAGSATQSDLERAETVLLSALRGEAQLQELFDAIAPRLAELKATKAAAVADRDNAKANLKRTVITSPIAGVIEALDIEVGENLAPGSRVARIIDPRKIELPLQLPASARSYVTKGNTVTINTRSQPDDCPPWSATVSRIGVVNGPTRTFTAFAEVDQSHVPLRNFAEGGGPYKLPAGAFALARLDTADPKPRIILPARAVQEGRIRTIVDGKVVGKPVKVAFEIEGLFENLGLPDTQWVVLEDDLEHGELVVLSASMTILDGQPVEPIVANPAITDNGGTP